MKNSKRNPKYTFIIKLIYKIVILIYFNYFFCKNSYLIMM